MKKDGWGWRLGLLVAAGALAAASGTCAAAPRTFVASWGNDAWPCTRAQPCRDFQAAIAAADAGGEVYVLDSGSYGMMYIDKSLSVVAPEGVHAGITVQGNYGILVTIAYEDHVLLRGLSLNVVGPGNHGVVFNSPGWLELQSLSINSHTGGGNGVGVNGYWEPEIFRRLRISDTTVRGFAYGLSASDAAYQAHNLEILVEDSTFIGANGYGLDFSNFHWIENVNIRGCVVAENGSAGAWIEANSLVASGYSAVAIEDTMFVFNGYSGLLVQGVGRPRTTLSDVVASGNDRGLSFSDLGSGKPNTFSRVNNTVVFDGTPYVGGLVTEPGK